MTVGQHTDLPADLHVTRHGAALTAALVLVTGMGFGRFAFTGIYPVMVQDGVLSIADGTLAASANYAGYLLGALAAMRSRPVHARQLCLWAVISTVVCLLLLAFVRAPWLIIGIRGAAGIASALAMVGASQWLLQHRGHVRGAPVLYAGVGTGIALSAEILAMGQFSGWHSGQLWALLAGTAGILCILIWRGMGTAHDSTPLPATASGTAAAQQIPTPARLILLYGLAGFGYIITATYLPLLVHDALKQLSPLQVWALFGLGAAPSCFLWHAVHVRLGTRQALFLNLLVQAMGVVLPVIYPSPAGYIASALLVGGTFMGTVTIAMPAARHVAHTVQMPMLAIMTAVYGLGQIAGPLVANALYQYQHSFSGSLLVAGAGLLAGAALCLRIRPS
ncbi:YbfB/YjiJ family MFS transporter [Undibacterium griseum]|uniref:YbfB/YjiJ family MFS transporter n=1 Tax=Undibacterium griseum TaxID=2762295 RepID=A0ABR6YPJ0_9BURK|nr:YbfB/YjiJ family MFS transporter [Undibacterium griseum]MBC3885812.1 YbfB/YjiJ family MFS transporter [Undibacterium griseum]